MLSGLSPVRIWLPADTRLVYLMLLLNLSYGFELKFRFSMVWNLWSGSTTSGTSGTMGLIFGFYGWGFVKTGFW